MNRLRQIHLYLGCVFTPLLSFFALSGLWQMFFLNRTWRLTEGHPRLQKWQSLLTTVHTGRSLKAGDTLSSPVFRYFVAAMAVSLLITMLLGLLMAFRFGRGRIAALCVVAGILTPLLLIAFAAR